jgi:hypothetical protein
MGHRPLDWDEWRCCVERALDFRDDAVHLHDLFADGGVFQDPANQPTTDIAAIEAITVRFCPDWRETIVNFRHGEDWAVFEWNGRGHFAGRADGAGRGVELTLSGMSMVEVDAAGRIVRYRDYLDRKDVIDQVEAALGREVSPN